MSLKDNLTHKIGPLPAIAWAGIAGVLVVGIAYKRKSAAAAADNTAAATVVPALPDVGSADDFTSGYSDATSSTTGASTASTTYVPPAVQTNNDWFQRAFQYLVSTGVSAADANTALNSYVYENGQVLNDTQYNAWQRALTFLGSPPDGALPTPNYTPAGTTTQSTTPVPIQTAPVVNDNGTITTSPVQPSAVLLAKQAIWDSYYANKGLVIPTVPGGGAAVQALIAAGWKPDPNQRPV